MTDNIKPFPGTLYVESEQDGQYNVWFNFPEPGCTEYTRSDLTLSQDEMRQHLNALKECYSALSDINDTVIAVEDVDFGKIEAAIKLLEEKLK